MQHFKKSKVRSGNHLSVCRESWALESDWPGREPLEKSKVDPDKYTPFFLTPFAIWHIHIHTHPHKHTPPSGGRGRLTSRAFISCQSGFIGFKWSLITTVLQSSTTALSSIGSFSVCSSVCVCWCVCVCVCVGLFLKSSFFLPNVRLSLFATFTTFHSNDPDGLFSLFYSLFSHHPSPSETVNACVNIRLYLWTLMYACLWVYERVCGSPSTNPLENREKMWREICVD